MTRIFNHGEIWLANLNSTKGTDPGKTRPVLILQNKTLLAIAHPSTIIVPLTTQLIHNAGPLRFRILAQDKLEENSDVLIDQVRAIDNKRLISGPLMQCQPSQLKKIHALIAEVMGL